MSLEIRLSHTLSTSGIYGPGLRYVIWVQGCSLECPGCWNSDLWSEDAGYYTTVHELVSEIIEENGIEGVTILGGEPLEQPDPVLELIIAVKEAGLTVMLYTGYEEEELHGPQLDCLALSDIVIMGRYIASLRDTNLRWRGSSNQKIRMMTDVYEGLEIEERVEVEITVDPHGEVSMAGYPERWLLKLLEGL